MAYRRVHVFYTGSVQGVGFRYTAQDIGSGLGLGGCVRNLPDGRVELICEGEEKTIKGFLDNIAHSSLGRYLKDTDISWEEPTKEFKSFDIRF